MTGTVLPGSTTPSGRSGPTNRRPGAGSACADGLITATEPPAGSTRCPGGPGSPCAQRARSSMPTPADVHRGAGGCALSITVTSGDGGLLSSLPRVTVSLEAVVWLA